MLRTLFLLTGLFLCLSSHAQQADAEQKRLVYFTDKANSPFSLEKPLEFLSSKSLERRDRQDIPLIPRDLPVNPSYVAKLKEAGATVWYTSRWFNAAVVQCSEAELAALKALPFVKGERALNRIAQPVAAQESKGGLRGSATSNAAYFPSLDSADYGLAFHQANMLGADELHEEGFAGQGMTIAVFDAGFPNVNSIPAFSHLFENNLLKGTFDFVTKEANVFSANAHGTAVLSTMAAYAPGKIIGTAYGANYLLLRTEDAASEHHIEEINWLLAAEYADSAGADVINSSLGYSSFDQPSVSYTYQEMDGNTALVSQAADYAAATGILVVVSAGNEGTKPWRYISAPADADSVLAVGAVDSLGMKASFSSFGPTADGQVKPDVVALGLKAYFLNTSGNVVQGNGTSFAGPILAGFATSLWQAQPWRSNMNMIRLLRELGSQAESPNNSTGYGIPNYSRIVTALPEVPLQESAYITNPVNRDPIILSLGQEWQQQQVFMQVLDATGKSVFSQMIPQPQAAQELELRAQQLPQGLYLCRIHGGSGAVTLRFVKL